MFLGPRVVCGYVKTRCVDFVLRFVFFLVSDEYLPPLESMRLSDGSLRDSEWYSLLTWGDPMLILDSFMKVLAF